MFRDEKPLLPLQPNEAQDYSTDAQTLTAPGIRGCEVIEYDDLTGQKEWEDSVFIQAFTDSVLHTTPAPLDLVID